MGLMFFQFVIRCTQRIGFVGNFRRNVSLAQIVQMGGEGQAFDEVQILAHFKSNGHGKIGDLFLMLRFQDIALVNHFADGIDGGFEGVFLGLVGVLDGTQIPLRTNEIDDVVVFVTNGRCTEQAGNELAVFAFTQDFTLPDAVSPGECACHILGLHGCQHAFFRP